MLGKWNVNVGKMVLIDLLNSALPQNFLCKKNIVSTKHKKAIEDLLYCVSRMTRAAACNQGPFFFSAVYYSISSVTQSCPTLCDPMDCSTPGFPVHHHLLELAQTHVRPVSYAIQSSHTVL